MFETAGHAIGVANVAEFADQLSHPPQWVCRYRGGEDFVEIANSLVAARGAV